MLHEVLGPFRVYNVCQIAFCWADSLSLHCLLKEEKNHPGRFVLCNFLMQCANSICPVLLFSHVEFGKSLFGPCLSLQFRNSVCPVLLFCHLELGKSLFGPFLALKFRNSVYPVRILEIIDWTCLALQFRNLVCPVLLFSHVEFRKSLFGPCLTLWFCNNSHSIALLQLFLYRLIGVLITVLQIL